MDLVKFSDGDSFREHPPHAFFDFETFDWIVVASLAVALAIAIVLDLLGGADHAGMA